MWWRDGCDSTPESIISERLGGMMKTHEVRKLTV